MASQPNWIVRRPISLLGPTGSMAHNRAESPNIGPTNLKLKVQLTCRITSLHLILIDYCQCQRGPHKPILASHVYLPQRQNPPSVCSWLVGRFHWVLPEKRLLNSTKKIFSIFLFQFPYWGIGKRKAATDHMSQSNFLKS